MMIRGMTIRPIAAMALAALCAFDLDGAATWLVAATDADGVAITNTAYSAWWCNGDKLLEGSSLYSLAFKGSGQTKWPDRFCVYKTGYRFKYFPSQKSTVRSIMTLGAENFSDEEIEAPVSLGSITNLPIITASTTTYQGFFAHAIANEYSISYAFGGGRAGESIPSDARYDTAFAVSAPTRTGYTFAGWRVSGTNPDCATARWGVSADEVSCAVRADTVCANGSAGEVWFKNLSSTHEGSVTLLAQWHTNAYAVTTEAVNGTLCVAGSGTYDQALAISWRPATKTGSAFTLRDVSVYGGSNDQGQLLGTFTSGTNGTFLMSATGGYYGNVHVKLVYGESLLSYAVDVASTDDARGKAVMSPPAGVYPYGTQIDIVATPCDGYAFSCWNDAGADRCNARRTVSVTGDFTYLASFTNRAQVIETYAIAFDGRGADNADDPSVMPLQTCLKGETEVLTPNAFVRTGYSFAGWAVTSHRAEKLIVDYADGSTVKDYVAIPNSTGTVHAVWATNRYLVAFDPNGATGSVKMEDQSFWYDQPQALSTNAFTRACYVFAGWSNTVNGALYGDRSVVSNLCGVQDGVCRLAALWKLDAGELSNALGCTNLVWRNHVVDDKNHYPWACNGNLEEGGVIQTNSTSGALAAEIATNGVVRFEARVKNKNNTKVNLYVCGKTSTLMENLDLRDTSKPKTNVVADVTDSAWHTFEFRVVADRSYVVYPAYLIMHHTGNDSGVCVRNLTWTPDGEFLRNCTISYSNLRGAENVNNPDAYREGQALSFERPTGTVSGYAFAGWSPSGISEEDRGNVLTVASWTPNTYTVEFRSNGAEGEMTSQSFLYDVPQALSKNTFTSVGYKFAGWRLEGGAGALFADGSVVKNLATGGNVVLDAVWKEVTTPCRIEVDGCMHEVRYGEAVTYETPVSVTNGFTNVVCVGWIGVGSVPATGTGNAVSFVATKDGSLAWLYRTNYWVSATVSPAGAASAPCQAGLVALKDAAGQSIANELWATAGTNLTAVATPDEGWVFAGWIDARSGAAVSSEATYVFTNSAPTLLKATFERKPLVRYPIAYEETKGCANANPTNYTVEDEIEFERLTAPAGWTFLGWSPERIESGTTGPVTVTALWEEKQAGGRAGTVVIVAAPETTLEGTVTWSAKNLPAGMKIAAKDLTDRTYGALEGGTLYGTPTKPGTYVVKITAKSGTKTQTFDVSVTVENYVDETLPLDDAYGDCVVGSKTWVELGEDFAGCKVTGLPTGLKFAAKVTQDSTFGAVSAGTIYGIPTKACTNCVIFAKTATETVSGKSQKVTHKASATFVVAALPTWAVGTFNGRLDDGPGSVTLTVAATGKASGKIVSGGKTWTFSATGFEAAEPVENDVASLTVEATAKCGKLTAAVTCTVACDGATGEISGDDLSASFTLWRNSWKDKGATDKLKPYVGVYTVQLECEESGYGYLSLTIDVKGNCKATGKLPDGTSAAASLPLVWQGDEEGGGAPMAIWQVSPSAYKGGYVGGLLKWDADLKVSGDDIAWVSLAPAASAEYGAGFSRTLSARGAWYNKLAALSEYYAYALTFCADTPSLDATVKTTAYNVSGKKVTTSAVEARDAATLDCWSSLSVSLNAKGTAFVVDQGKATRPVQDKDTREWSYAGDNDAALTFAFTKTTGVFKGTFTCWYDYVSAVDETKDPVKETLTHTSKKVSYEGVMVLGEALRGYYLWERTGSYENEKTLKTTTYKYKESRPVVFE